MTPPVMLRRRDGGPLAVHHLGGDGPPLLISHATGFHGRCYRSLAAHITGWSVWALDYRGHGASRDDAAEPLDWWCFVDDFDVVVEHLGSDGPIPVVGHSMGAATVLLAALRGQDGIAGLVGFEPIAPPPSDMDPDTLPIAQGARRRRAVFDSVESAIANYASKPPLAALAADVLDDYVRFGTIECDDGVELACRPSFEAAVFTSAHRNGLFDRLTEIDLDVTVISGIVEEMQPSAFASAIAERLPNGRLINRSDLDHFGPFVDPASTAATINEALSSYR